MSAAVTTARERIQVADASTHERLRELEKSDGPRFDRDLWASLAETGSSVYVVPRDNVVLSGDRGSVPVTVTNDFDQTVRVGVVITADPAARLDAQPLESVEIEPGRRADLYSPLAQA